MRLVLARLEAYSRIERVELILIHFLDALCKEKIPAALLA